MQKYVLPCNKDFSFTIDKIFYIAKWKQLTHEELQVMVGSLSWKSLLLKWLHCFPDALNNKNEIEIIR